MARSRRNRYGSSENPLSSLTNLLAAPKITPLSTYLSSIEDHRNFHPAPALRSPLTRFATPARIQSPSTQKTKTIPRGVQFVDFSQVIVCEKRKQRKEVLFAKKKAGRGGNKKSRRWTRLSNINCS